MTDSIPTAPYPLQWPEGQARRKNRERSAFRTKMEGAVKNVRDSLRLFAQDSGKALQGLVVTSNASLFDHGPADPGVAVWFIWDGAVRCIAVDRYLSIAENLQAIHQVLEARRVELRHAGIEMARTAFKGFIAALPPPDRKAWHEVLGVGPDASREEINLARRMLARELGADHPRMAEINAAYDEAMKHHG